MNEAAQPRRRVDRQGSPVDSLCYGNGEVGHCQYKMTDAAVSQPQMAPANQAIMPARALQHSLADKRCAKNWNQPLVLHRLCVCGFCLAAAHCRLEILLAGYHCRD